MCFPTPWKTLIRWERGQLGRYDPATGRQILTYNVMTSASTLSMPRPESAN